MGALAAAGWGGLHVARHATVGSGRGWLGVVVARQAAGRNWRSASTGGFLVIAELDNQGENFYLETNTQYHII